MQELLVMEGTLMKGSFQLSKASGIFPEPVVNEENEFVDSKITPVLSEDKKELKEEMFSDMDPHISIPFMESDNVSPSCLTHSVKEGFDDHQQHIEHSLEHSCTESCISQEPNVSVNSIISEKQSSNVLDTQKQEYMGEQNITFKNIQDAFSIDNDINAEGLENPLPVSTNEKPLAETIHNIENNGNEFHSKCENETQKMEPSNTYLSQWISNSVDNVGENDNKHSSQPAPSSGKDKSSHQKSLSKIDEAEKTSNHIQYLLEHLPDLAKSFDLHKKIGVGTFSTVFLGSIKREVALLHPELHDKKFAVKHLVPTIHPKRIARELKYLHQIGGKDNVCGVSLCLRKDDCVVIIMPYLAHKRFSEYNLHMDADEARDYMRNLMIALRRVHSFNVIHRDVKPSNFLYDRESRRFLLVDFGLSQNVHPQAKWTHERARKRKRQEENDNENINKLGQTPHKPNVDFKSKRMALQPRSRGENVSQGCNGVLQPTKRLKLNDTYTRGQKIIDHLHQQKTTLVDSKRTPLTPKASNCQNTLVTQNFKLPYSSPKLVEKDLNIKKKLFPSNNENKLPIVHIPAVEGESPVKSNLASPYASRRVSYQQALAFNSPSHNSTSNSKGGVGNTVGSTQDNEFSKQKFQTLVPKPSKEGNCSGSTIVRVQNSQVKSQMLKPLSPLESEQQRKLLFNRQQNKRCTKSLKELKCFCKGMPQVCSACLKLRTLPVPRAGTPGFRPPEVLLKYPLQTTAVDMWAAGVIMLCILSGCYPFFHSPDDITGLAEIMTIFGTDSIKQVAKNLGRTVQCSHDKPPLDLRKLCERLHRRRKERMNGVPDTTSTLPICPKCENTIEIEYNGCLCLEPNAVPSTSGEFPPSAYDLLQKLLDLNPASRISAEEALQHPFLMEC